MDDFKPWFRATTFWLVRLWWPVHRIGVLLTAVLFLVTGVTVAAIETGTMPEPQGMPLWLTEGLCIFIALRLVQDRVEWVEPPRRKRSARDLRNRIP